MMAKTEAKVVIFDLETTPIISYNWGIWEQNAIEVIEDWQILCFAYKWLHAKKTFVVAQNDFEDYKPGVNNDEHVVKALWELFDEADVVIGHNSDQFDIKKTNARFIYYDLIPPSFYRKLDTKKIAKRYAGFTSNKLDDLGDTLDLGRKEHTGGFDTWKGCMAGDERSWKRMKKYNKQDVLLDESLYLRFLPWIENHPSMGLMLDRPEACPKCGEGPMTLSKKKKYAKVGWSIQYRCVNCGGFSTVRMREQADVRYVN